jgi:hypothetical protein
MFDARLGRKRYSHPAAWHLETLKQIMTAPFRRKCHTHARAVVGMILGTHFPIGIGVIGMVMYSFTLPFRRTT